MSKETNKSINIQVKIDNIPNYHLEILKEFNKMIVPHSLSLGVTSSWLSALKNIEYNIQPQLTQLKNINYNVAQTLVDINLSMISDALISIKKFNYGADLINSMIMSNLASISKTFSYIKLPKLDIDFNNIKRLMYMKYFKEFKGVTDKLYHDTIFPPINYIIENEINHINECDIGKFIFTDNIINFYIEKIDTWKEKYTDKNTIDLIMEIKSNLINGNKYSIISLTSTLIEYLLGQSILSDYLKKSNGKRYPAIRTMLYNEVFKPLNIEHLYYKFIKNNLYKDSKKAQEFSRHITHGENLELGTMKSALNIIFIYDFIQEILQVKEIYDDVA